MTEAINALMAKGEWAEAKKECERSIEAMPTCADGYAYLGLCHFHGQEWRQALECFQKSTCLNPKYWQAGMKMAQCLDRLAQFEDAFEVAKHWQSIHPGDAQLNALVESLRRYERKDSADGWQRSKYRPDHHITVTH